MEEVAEPQAERPRTALQSDWKGHEEAGGVRQELVGEVWS